jgi:thymidine phosphorylase
MPATGGVWFHETHHPEEYAMIISYVAEGLAHQLSDSRALHARQHSSRGVPEQLTHHHFPRVAVRRSRVPVAVTPLVP